MCGFGGILRTDGQPIPREWLDIIDARIAHRGPDGHGVFTDRVEQSSNGETRITEIALVHRRLSIIDIDGGHQPMVWSASSPPQRPHDPEGSHAPIAVVFNGCIYNHRDLRAQLEAEGYAFTTDHSDTEVLIHGYRRWGADLEDHLEGMYAFAIWDSENARLLLGRDTFGEKPLFVRWSVAGNDKIIAFSTDARALFLLDHDPHQPTPAPDRGSRAPGSDRATNPQWHGRLARARYAAAHPAAVVKHSRGENNAHRSDTAPTTSRWLERYLQAGYNWDAQTVYHVGTKQHPGVIAAPITILHHTDSIVPANPQRETSQAEFEKLLDAAVAQRLEADVPLGCFLSGGVDSSLITALAVRHKPDLRTFTVRMPDAHYDESSHAEAVAQHLGADHTTLDVAINPADDLVHLIHTLGQPFADSSILPTYWVSRAARTHVRVALSGDGADELFLGYDRYMHARALMRHHRALKWIPKSWFGRWHPKSRKHKLGRLGEMARDSYRTGIIAMEAVFSRRQITELLGRAPRQPIYVNPGFDPMLALRRADLQHYLPGDLLTKVDTASMAVALEVRAPYLDSAVVDAAVNTPTWMLAPNNKPKHVLRNIAKKYIPAELLDRPKMGFAIPIGEWFRSDFGNMKSLLLDHLDAPQPFGPFELNAEAIQSLIDQHMTGDYDHGQRLFALLTLAIWARLS